MRIIRADGEVMVEIPDHTWHSMFSDDQASVLRAYAGGQPERSISDAVGDLPPWALVLVAWGFFACLGWLIWVLATH